MLSKKEADEMFEELGYKKIVNNHFVIAYEKDEYIIEFNFIYETVEKYYSNKKLYAKIDMEELQAINKKVEELGWNEL